MNWTLLFPRVPTDLRLALPWSAGAWRESPWPPPRSKRVAASICTQQAPPSSAGGPAASTAWAGLVINFCQHLAIGCCTNLLQISLCRRMDMPDAFHRCRTLHFFAS